MSEKKTSTKAARKRKKSYKDKKEIIKKETIKEKRTFKEFWQSELTLKVVFFLLLILVMVLSILVYQKNKKVDEEVRANIVIPILKEEDHFDLKISASSLAISKEYILKITNYKDGIINPSELSYKITIENGADCILEVTKDDLEENLMIVQEKSEILNQVLIGGEKEEVYYHIRMKLSNSVQNDDLIQVHIES